MTTDRIDSEQELIEFIQKLKMANIEIPENVTLEIDSEDLQDCLIRQLNTWIFPYSKSIDRFKYMGEKMMFKKNNNDGQGKSE